MAGGDKKIHEHPRHNTNGFDKNPGNIGKGRNKKIYTILKAKGYSKDDITTAFGELAFYTLPELKKVFEADDMPVITRIVANQFYSALKKSDWSKIKEILEHVVGKPKQEIDQKNTHETETPIIFENVSKKYMPKEKKSNSNK